MSDISDDMIRKAVDGDAQAFEAIYKAYSGFVYNVSWRVVRNEEDAKEVTQDVFVAVYQKLKSFRFESSLKTWLYRMSVNYAINYAKKSSKTKDKMVEYDVDSDDYAGADEIKANVDREHHSKMVDSLLESLNEEQRTCVILRNMEGLSYQQMADTLNININTVRSRLKRAREKLLEFKKRGAYESV